MVKPNDLINMPVDTARSICTENGLTLRVVEEDGEPYIVTCDYRTDRINVAVKDKTVSETRGIG